MQLYRQIGSVSGRQPEGIWQVGVTRAEGGEFDPRFVT